MYMVYYFMKSFRVPSDLEVIMYDNINQNQNLLLTSLLSEISDYFFFKSFLEKDCMISGQYPLPEYTEDLLRLIRDFDARIVVFLCPVKDLACVRL